MEPQKDQATCAGKRLVTAEPKSEPSLPDSKTFLSTIYWEPTLCQARALGEYTAVCKAKTPVVMELSLQTQLSPHTAHHTSNKQITRISFWAHRQDSTSAYGRECSPLPHLTRIPLRGCPDSNHLLIESASFFPPMASRTLKQSFLVVLIKYLQSSNEHDASILQSLQNTFHMWSSLVLIKFNKVGIVPI